MKIGVNMIIHYVWTHNEHNKSIGIQSAPGKTVYNVSLSYSIAEKKWRSYMCECGDFKYNMSCKHMRYGDEYTKDFPRPEHGVPQPSIENNIYRCSFCNAINFMIVAPHGFSSDHTLVCLKCGRGYLI